MLNKKAFVFLPLILVGCSANDSQIRQDYARHYAQPDAYIQAYKQKIQSMDVNALAVYAAAEDKKQMRGQERLKVDEMITVEDIQAKGNKVVYDYSLSEQWATQPPAKQLATQTTMQKDLIYRTCSLKTVQLAQDKGLEEEHNYYNHYADQLAFTLRTSAQICKSNGFRS